MGNNPTTLPEAPAVLADRACMRPDRAEGSDEGRVPRRQRIVKPGVRPPVSVIRREPARGASRKRPRVPWAEELPRGRGEGREGLDRPSGTSRLGGRRVKAGTASRARRHFGGPKCRNGGAGGRCVTGRGRSGPREAGGTVVTAANSGAHVGMWFASSKGNRLSFTDCRASEGSERRRAVRFPPCKPTKLAYQTSPTKPAFHKYPITGLDRKPLGTRPPATAGGLLFVRHRTAVGPSPSARRRGQGAIGRCALARHARSACPPRGLHHRQMPASS